MPGYTEAQTALEDQKVGTPAWYESMIQGYLLLRDKYALPYWQCAFELFESEQFTGFGAGGANTAYGLLEVQPARVFGLVQQIEAQVVANRPQFVVDPIKARSEDLAMWGGIVTNADWERTGAMMDELRMATRHTILTGWGPMLSGVETDYDAARRDRKRRLKIAEQIQADPLLGEIQAELIGEMAQGMDSVDEPKRETSYEMTDLTWKGRVFSRAISPFQFLVDPNASSLEDAEWCGRIIIARLDEVKRNPLFSNTKRLKATGFFAGAPEARAAMSPERGNWNKPNSLGRMLQRDDIERIQLFELYIREPDGGWTKKLFAKDTKKPLQEVPDCYDIGCPYRLLRWNHTPRRIFTTSDVQPIMTEVIQEREIKTRLHDGYMRSPVDTYVSSSQYIPQDIDKHVLTVRGIGNIIRLENLPIGVNPELAIGLLKKNNQTAEAIQYLQILERSFEVSTGLGANQQASALKSETSATEAAEIAKWAGARGRSKFAFAERFAAGVASDRLGLICQFYDEYDIAALAGPEAAKFWVKEKFTPGDIQSGLSIRVEQGTMQPRDDAAVAAMLKEMFILCVTPATAGIANVYINAGEVFSELLRRMGVPKGSKLVNDIGPDITQKLGMLLQSLAQQGAGGGGGGGAPGPSPTPSGRAEVAQVA